MTSDFTFEAFLSLQNSRVLKDTDLLTDGVSSLMYVKTSDLIT